ncbi:MAG: bis(5'-nucleosyl)-tetraphosphatase (symmetrical) YqeK [Clostridia bacterium]|nr:bis(5'-nucleosyl)-tetraphosphatase (symmetrical) YqeK [Clostridia bacterium]
MTINEMKSKLQVELRPNRFSHSVNVMNTAIDLAKKYNVNTEKAAIAGLLHDCARDIRGEKVFKLCSEYGIEVNYITKKQPELLHGPLGSRLATVEYGVEDADIISAIDSHTTGCKDMSLLSKIVFLADFIEPARNFPGVDEVRRLAFEDIDAGMVSAFDRTITYVIERGALIHPETVEARNFIVYSLSRHESNK